MNVKKLLVVGSGTAGLISAILLKTRFNIQIDVIFSKSIGIVGVGEGSTEHFKEFMQFVGIDQYELIKETDATYKSGIMFEGWNESPYLHSVASPFDHKLGQYRAVYARQISVNSDYILPKYSWNSQVPLYFLDRPDLFSVHQFHFNTYKLNEFLINFAKKIGIRFYDDEVVDVNFTESGFIKSVIGKKDSYNYDFYIDSTGFKRILINKMGAKWTSYKKYLKMNSAITFQTEDEEEYNKWTLSKTMDAGWLFKIPTWGRHGNGYIFSDEYITEVDAKKEVENYLQKPVNIGKKFSFDPGCLEKAWIKNCCAIGLSSSFVEPLEASSIGTSIQQSFLLMHKIANYNEHSVIEYNKSFTDIMENIRDFIALHYVTKKTNSLFWQDIQNTELPYSLKFKLESWKNKLPIDEDFSDSSKYILFTAHNFIVVLNGLKLFNVDSISAEYNLHTDYIKEFCKDTIEQHLHFEKTEPMISHKKMINYIRNNY